MKNTPANSWDQLYQDLKDTWDQLSQDLKDTKDAYESAEIKIMLATSSPPAEAVRMSLEKAKLLYETIEKMREIAIKIT